MSWFQGLSGGNTWSAARMRSASGVSNMIGTVMVGSGGRDGPDCDATIAAAAPRTQRTTNPVRRLEFISCAPVKVSHQSKAKPEGSALAKIETRHARFTGAEEDA